MFIFLIGIAMIKVFFIILVVYTTFKFSDYLIKSIKIIAKLKFFAFSRKSEMLKTTGKKTLTLIILHTAVFLAGWTGIFGRLISLGGLPLVWYRMMTSVVQPEHVPTGSKRSIDR